MTHFCYINVYDVRIGTIHIVGFIMITMFKKDKKKWSPSCVISDKTSSRLAQSTPDFFFVYQFENNSALILEMKKQVAEDSLKLFLYLCWPFFIFFHFCIINQRQLGSGVPKSLQKPHRNFKRLLRKWFGSYLQTNCFTYFSINQQNIC